MDEYRAASLQGWSSVAADWGELATRIDQQLKPAADWILEAVSPRPGDRVLELAGGPGTLSILIAERVAPDGTVLHTDFSEEMVKVAWQRFETEGVGGVESRVMDAEQTDLPDASMDVVVCRMGYMLMGDPATALRESARVLARGGRLALAVWTDAASNPWVSLGMQAVAEELSAPPPPPDAPGMWSLGDRQRVEELLRNAGLDEIRIEVLDGSTEYESTAEWLEGTKRLAGPLRALFANLDQTARDAIERRLLELVKPYEQSDGRLVMPQQMLVASAVRLDSD